MAGIFSTSYIAREGEICATNYTFTLLASLHSPGQYQLRDARKNLLTGR
jgi:hypothetical protein